MIFRNKPQKLYIVYYKIDTTLSILVNLNIMKFFNFNFAREYCKVFVINYFVVIEYPSLLIICSELVFCFANVIKFGIALIRLQYICK